MCVDCFYVPLMTILLILLHKFLNMLSGFLCLTIFSKHTFYNYRFHVGTSKLFTRVYGWQTWLIHIYCTLINRSALSYSIMENIPPLPGMETTTIDIATTSTTSTYLLADSQAAVNAKRTATDDFEEMTTIINQLQIPNSVIPVILVAGIIAGFVLIPCCAYRFICKSKPVPSCRCLKKDNSDVYEDPFNVDDATDDVSDNKSWIGATSSVTSGIDCSSQGSVYSQSPPPNRLKRSTSQPCKTNPGRFVVILLDEKSSPPKNIHKLKTRATSLLGSIDERSPHRFMRRHSVMSGKNYRCQSCSQQLEAGSNEASEKLHRKNSDLLAQSQLIRENGLPQAVPTGDIDSANTYFMLGDGEAV